MTKILLIEDDDNLAKILSMELRFEQYEVVLHQDGLEGLQAALQDSFDLILLDLMLPSMNGFEITRRVRLVNPDTSIIMMTAKDSLTDVIHGLDSGADDYLSKPFATEELLARIRVLLRRRQVLQQRFSQPAAMSFAGQVTSRPQASLQAEEAQTALQLDPGTRTVTYQGRMVQLSKREFALLNHFNSAPERIFSRAEIFEAVWKKNSKVSAETNIVDVYIRYLRKKLGKSIVRTVYGKGYSLGEIS